MVSMDACTMCFPPALWKLIGLGPTRDLLYVSKRRRGWAGLLRLTHTISMLCRLGRVDPHCVGSDWEYPTHLRNGPTYVCGPHMLTDPTRPDPFAASRFRPIHFGSPLATQITTGLDCKILNNMFPSFQPDLTPKSVPQKSLTTNIKTQISKVEKSLQNPLSIHSFLKIGKRTLFFFFFFFSILISFSQHSKTLSFPLSRTLLFRSCTYKFSIWQLSPLCLYFFTSFALIKILIKWWFKSLIHLGFYESGFLAKETGTLTSLI